MPFFVHTFRKFLQKKADLPKKAFFNEFGIFLKKQAFLKQNLQFLLKILILGEIFTFTKKGIFFNEFRNFLQKKAHKKMFFGEIFTKKKHRGVYNKTDTTFANDLKP